MSDATHEQLIDGVAEGTTGLINQSRSLTNNSILQDSIPIRINQTLNSISAFFQPRLRSQQARSNPSNRSTIPQVLPISAQQQPCSSTTSIHTQPAHLIPIQVIITTTQRTATETRTNPNIPSERAQEDSPDSDVAANDTNAQVPLSDRLQRARALWTEMFTKAPRTTASTQGHRPIALTMENQVTNEPWGDEISGPKSATITRIYAMNVNGLRLDQRGGQLDVLSKVLKEVEADVFCGQEHNLESNHTSVKQIIYKTTREHWKRSKVTFATTPILFPRHYKPGGTFMISSGNITSRIIDTYQDKWGRWVYQTLQGKHATKIRIYSVYQVVDSVIKPGTITIAAQQQSLLMQTKDNDLNPRSAFRRDLTIDIEESIATGHEVLILGDFNEVFGVDPEGMIKLATQCGLKDIFADRNSSQPPTTYARGRSRLDYALATDHVLKSISKAGYEAFNVKYHSDHRAYFLDFDTETLFGADTQHLGTPPNRILHSRNVAQTTKYIKIKYDMLLAHNAFTRGDRLAESGNRHAFAERLDKDVLAASLAAEQQLQRFGEPVWSIKLDRARRTVVNLKKCLSMARTKRNVIPYLNQSKRAWEEDFAIPTTVAECNKRLRAAEKKVDECIKESFANREQEQHDKITALQQSPFPADKAEAIQMRNLRKAEENKQLFSKLKAVRQADARRGVTRIEIPVHPQADPKTCTEWQQIDVPSEILQHLQARNRLHFGQAQGSPFTTIPLVEDLGYQGTGAASNDILQGMYDTTGLDDNVALLIQHLKQSEEMAALDSRSTISEEEYVGKIRVWRESTSTSPSGMHLGHYKASIARHEYTDIDSSDELASANQDEWNHMQSCLLKLQVQLLNYAMERGYSYNRWKQVVNAILFKDTDNVRIHRTRVIHLYEADYNLMLGIKWRMALYQAEALRELHDGQYGSRPRRNAFDPVFIEEMQFEIARASRKTLVQTNYDAMSCYDRIIISLAMIASRKYGVPLSITTSNAKTLEEAEYRIRTELGVSETGYTHSDEYPIHGTGQGSGNSPMIWCFISCILFDCYDSIAYPTIYCNPDKTQEMELGMVGFVDDSNGQTNDFMYNESASTIPSTLHKLEHNTQAWTNILGASGGSLELPKVNNHFVHYGFTAKGDPFLMEPHMIIPHPVEITDPLTNDVHEMEFLSPTEAHKTLGHQKEPAGTQETQFKKLWKQSDTSTEFIWKCHLTRREAWTYYYACYLPSIGYPLACSSLSKSQLDRIQRKAMQIIIARCGYNRNTKKEIIYGPMSYGGSNFRHLYMQQGVGQITTFMKHWRRTQTIPGKLLRCALAWTQLNAGTSYSILQQVHEKLPHLESKWFSSMRDFMSEINATIELDTTGVPPCQRQHDKHIMDQILSSNKFTAAQIRRLNYCRLYLQATTISDITDATGRRLDPAKLLGTFSGRSSTTTWLKVNQGRPSKAEWQLWRRANKLWSKPNGILNEPLGSWLDLRKKQRQQHFAYKRNNIIYIRANDRGLYHICIPTPIPGDYRLHPRTRTFKNMKNDVFPVEVYPSLRNPDHWTLHPRYYTQLVIPPEATIPVTFHAFIETLEPWEIDLLRHTTLKVDPTTICEILSQGLRAASDGSVRISTQGAYGWALCNAQGDKVATGMGPARGPRPSSYRAEAYGLLSILRFLIRIAEFTKQTTPWKGILATDSQSVLKTLGGSDNQFAEKDEPVNIDGNQVVLDVLCPDWDILIEIQHALRDLPDLMLKFIRGHQDDTIEYEKLPLLARLNVDADGLAGQYQDTYGQDRPLALMTPRTKVLLHLFEGTVTSSTPETLRHAYCGPPLLEAIRSKNQWSHATVESVNWQAHGSAIRKQMPKRIHYVKLVHDILPTHSYLNKQDQGQRTCPCCRALTEDRDHILRCPTPEREKWRTTFIRKIEEACNKRHTYMPLKMLLLNALKKWLYPGSTPHDEPQCVDYGEDMHQLIAEQTRLGWRQIFNGRFSQQWSELQNQHLYQIRHYLRNKNQSGHKWQVAIITVIWEQWYDLWTLRNADVHGKDVAAKALAEKRELRRRLELIYNRRAHMEPSAQDLLFQDITTHLEQPPSVINSWLIIQGPVFAQSIRRVKARAIQNVRSIREYFADVPALPPD